MMPVESYIKIIAFVILLKCFNYTFGIPELIFGSFRGVGGLRIQTYALKVENPRARAVLIHGSRCHFAAEFLVSEHSFIKNCNKCNNPVDSCSHGSKSNHSTIGTLEVENKTINIYEDGTNGWEVDDYYTYEDTFSQILNDNNISVYGMDMRSYGRSESPTVYIAGKVRGMIDDYDNLARDVVMFIEKIKREEGEDIPIYLLGVSMGGTVVTRAVQLYRNKKLVDGIILMAPMMGVLRGMLKSFYLKTMPIHGFLSKIFPSIILIKGGYLLSDPFDTLRHFDPLTLNGGVPYRTAYISQRLLEETLKDARLIHPDTSVLVFHSIEDDVCLYQSTEQFYNSLYHLNKKRLVTLNDIGHRILVPPLCEQYGNYISEWINNGDSNIKLDHESYTLDT